MTWTAESYSANTKHLMCHIYKIGHRWHWRVYDMRTATHFKEGVAGSLVAAQNAVEQITLREK